MRVSSIVQNDLKIVNSSDVHDHQLKTEIRSNSTLSKWFTKIRDKFADYAIAVDSEYALALIKEIRGKKDASEAAKVIAVQGDPKTRMAVAFALMDIAADQPQFFPETLARLFASKDSPDRAIEETRLLLQGSNQTTSAIYVSQKFNQLRNSFGNK